MAYHLKNVRILAHQDAMDLYLEMILMPKWSSVVSLFITYLSAVFGARKVTKSRALATTMAYRLILGARRDWSFI